jgi:hypothetical protein
MAETFGVSGVVEKANRHVDTDFFILQLDKILSRTVAGWSSKSLISRAGARSAV